MHNRQMNFPNMTPFEGVVIQADNGSVVSPNNNVILQLADEQYEVDLTTASQELLIRTVGQLAMIDLNMEVAC